MEPRCIYMVKNWWIKGLYKWWNYVSYISIQYNQNTNNNKYLYKVSSVCDQEGVSISFFYFLNILINTFLTLFRGSSLGQTKSSTGVVTSNFLVLGKSISGTGYAAVSFASLAIFEKVLAPLQVKKIYTTGLRHLCKYKVTNDMDIMLWVLFFLEFPFTLKGL